MYESIDVGADRSDSPRDESDDATERARDERELYGQPCHEVDAGCDEQTLYGDPQHETTESPDVPDLELLFVRMRSESAVGTNATASDASPSDTSALDISALGTSSFDATASDASSPVGTTER